MKILIVCQYYHPEPFRITDICEELVARGHQVKVLTGLPNYPMGYIYDDYKKGKKRHEMINGVDVQRCFTIGRRNNAVFRLLNYFSFMISSSLAVSKLKDEYDLVFVNQLSPVMMANAGVWYKKKYKKKMILYCLDLWPESLVVGGISRGSFLYRLFHKISKKMYQNADEILITSNSFSDYFADEFGISNTKYFPQYAESLFTADACKKESSDTVDLMFAGNVGAAQSVDTIIKAADLSRDIQGLKWHIVGEGSELEKCKTLANDLGLTSVVFHGRKDLSEMPAYYSMADAMLLTMKKEPIISLTLPGKVQTYMAAGKPIIGAVDGESHFVIENSGCGFCGEAENAEELAKNVRSFIETKNKLEFSEKSINYYNDNFTKTMFIDRLLQVFASVIDPDV